MFAPKAYTLPCIICHKLNTDTCEFLSASHINCASHSPAEIAAAWNRSISPAHDYSMVNYYRFHQAANRPCWMA